MGFMLEQICATQGKTFIYSQGHKVHAVNQEHNVSVVGYWL